MGKRRGPVELTEAAMPTWGVGKYRAGWQDYQYPGQEAEAVGFQKCLGHRDEPSTQPRPALLALTLPSSCSMWSSPPDEPRLWPCRASPPICWGMLEAPTSLAL